MRRDRGLAPGWLWLVMWLGVRLVVPPCAAAQTVRGGARVSTLVDACVPIDPEQFHRVLAIELGTSIEYSPTAAQQPDGASVRVVCLEDMRMGSGSVQLQLEDNLTRKSMQRVVELPDADVGTRTRLLALSVAEFVVASWVELQLAQPPIAPSGPPVPSEAAQQASQLAGARLPQKPTPTPTPTTPMPAPTPAPTPAPAEPEPAPTSGVGARWLVGVSVEPVIFTLNAGLMQQVTLHLEERPSRHLALGLGLSLGHASWSVNWPTEKIGSALISSSSARLSLAYVAVFDALELSGGAGVRGGIAYMAGVIESSTAETERMNVLAGELYAPWGGPVLLLSAAALIGAFRVAVELEGGYVTLPAQALLRESSQPPSEGVVVAELRGVWAAASLYLGWMF